MKMPATRKKYNNICITGDYTELEKAREFVKSKAMLFGFGDEEAQKIALAVDEACSNLIRHAFRLEPNRQICIQIETHSKQFVVNILDDGAPFNPLDVLPQDMNEYLRQYHRGGLGIQIMRLVMDEIAYFPSNETQPKNILKLKKVLGV